MAGLTSKAMALALYSAFEASMEPAFLLVQGNPRVVQFRHDGHYFTAKVYIWTMTHGGGAARPANEWRIQITGVNPPLQFDTDYTIIMGYEPNLKVFAGWDVRKHQTWSSNSPSLQITLETLHAALQDGFAFYRKDNDELTVAMRPELVTQYIVHSELLHTYGDPTMAAALANAASDPFLELPDDEDEDEDRQSVLSVVKKLCRDSKFQRIVLGAYEYRCAVTRAQLGLVQAAHILPVAAPKSMDKVTNGIALSPTYHLAYDAGLIYLDTDYSMKTNDRQIAQLTERGWLSGLDGFCAPLGPIHLPPDTSWYPSKSNIKKAIDYRKVLG